MKLEEITCPRCKKPNTYRPDNAFRPFCSERCKMIDLGAWADETHRVPGSDVDPEEFDDKFNE